MYPELYTINDIFGISKITFYTYAVCIILGAFLASMYGKRIAKKELNINVSNSFIYILFIAGFVGGKFFFYFERPMYYINDPSAILQSFSSGFVFYGSFVFIVSTAIWYFKKRSISILPMLDILAVSTAIIQVIGRIGCFCAGCCYGVPTESNFGFIFPTSHGNAVHPTQLYESFAVSTMLIFLLMYKKHKKFQGQLFLMYLSFYALSRFTLEIFRGDNRGQIIKGALSHSQGIAICLLLVSITMYYKLNKQFVNN